MGRVGRFLVGLILMIMIAAVVAGAVIAVTDRAASVKIREWAGQSVDDLSGELRQTLRDNTR